MIDKAKTIIRIIIGIFIVTLITIVFFLTKSNKTLKEDLSISVANEKAFALENSGLKNMNREFQFTINQLEYFNDSLIDKMNSLRKELKIKDKNLKQMQYLLSEARKRDTIIFRDTIFRDKSFSLDTLMGDKWYQLELELRYPNTIITEPTFISEKFVVISYKKETINPPKKCAIARWFQKKHKVVEVEVVEKNPYIENKQQRFIEIVK